MRAVLLLLATLFATLFASAGLAQTGDVAWDPAPLDTHAGVLTAQAGTTGDAPDPCRPAQLQVVQGDDVHQFAVEVVDTPQTRARGLMFRPSLAPNAGMLFVYERPQPVAFWMRNTLISLDLLFAGPDGRIGRIHANAVPLDETSIPGGDGIQFVLEIPGGRAAELGIAPGARMRHPAITDEPCAATLTTG